MTPDQSREVEEASTLFSQSSSDITSPYTCLLYTSDAADE